MNQEGSKLSASQRKVLKEKGTEAPFTGALLENKDSGAYICADCGTELFSSKTKYNSNSGWPSFYDVMKTGVVKLEKDESLGTTRTEVLCATCGGHLGHVFDDGPVDKTGKRYCINSCALNFMSEDGEMVRGDGELDD